MARVTEDTTYEVYLTSEEMTRVADGGIVEVTIDGNSVEFGAEPTHFTNEFDVPNEGEIVLDPAAPRWSSGEVEVTDVTDVAASDYEITVQGIETTVLRENPSSDPSAPVVLGRYVGGSGREYAFPVDRLER